MYMVATLQFHACGQINAWAFYPDAVKPKARTYGHNPILMQYTGLKDKNGREIYEGDLLQDEGGGIGKVVWWQDDSSFSVEYPDIEIMQLTKDFEEAVEVIGNIYENTELLSK
jgi:uncharacterized phage protein (TIGR01671 family)